MNSNQLKIALYWLVIFANVVFFIATLGKLESGTPTLVNALAITFSAVGLIKAHNKE